MNYYGINLTAVSAKVKSSGRINTKKRGLLAKPSFTGLTTGVFITFRRSSDAIILSRCAFRRYDNRRFSRRQHPLQVVDFPLNPLLMRISILNLPFAIFDLLAAVLQLAVKP